MSSTCECHVKVTTGFCAPPSIRYKPLSTDHTAVIPCVMTCPKQGAKRVLQWLPQLQHFHCSSTAFGIYYLEDLGSTFPDRFRQLLQHLLKKTSTCSTKYLEKSWYKHEYKLGNTKRAYCGSSWFSGALSTWIVPSARHM